MWLWVVRIATGFFGRSFWPYWLIVAGVAIMGAAFAYEALGWHAAVARLGEAQVRIEALEAEKAKLEIEKAKLEVDLDRQSKEVADFASRMDRQRGASLNALAKAKAEFPSTEAQVTALLNKVVNTDNIAACLAADKALLELH